MKQIGVIINPHAKKVRTGRISLDDFFSIAPDIVDARITQTLEEIDDVIKDFKRAAIPYVGITGGDGSLHHVITRMIKIYGENPLPAIVILKGGTMDNVSRTIKLRGKGHSILKRLASALKAGREIRIFERDTMQIGDAYCFLFGTGVVTNFLNAAYSGEKGFIRNFQVISMALRHAIKEPAAGSLYKGVTARTWVDGTELGFTKITGLLAGTVEHVSTYAFPLYRANEKPGTFHALITGLTPRQIWRKIYFIFGIPVKHPNHFDGVMQNLRLEGSESFEYTMDGDIYKSDGKLEVKIGKRIRLVYI